jgi:hypothetical protein
MPGMIRAVGVWQANQGLNDRGNVVMFIEGHAGIAVNDGWSIIFDRISPDKSPHSDECFPLVDRLHEIVNHAHMVTN